jgi:hypothetical protein
MKELFSGSLPEDEDNAIVYQGDRRLPLSAVFRVSKGRRVTI